jgi:hypothetical protein
MEPTTLLPVTSLLLIIEELEVARLHVREVIVEQEQSPRQSASTTSS